MLQQEASLHEHTVQAVGRGDLDPLPRVPRSRRSLPRSSRVTEEHVPEQLMAVARQLAAQRPGTRIVIENATEVWIR